MKTRSMCEIYEVGTPNSFSLFALFSQIDDPLTFEEAIEEYVWAQAMDEEIECIEKNQIWDWLMYHNIKMSLASNGFIRTSKMLMEMCRSTRRYYL